MNSKKKGMAINMLNLVELEQFVAFADNGTLLKVSEKLHISQPTLTRSMRHVEEDFGVALFVRGKNKIELNETGRKAVEYARKLLDDTRNAVSMVQAFDRQLRTITIHSCAPVPLWSLLPMIAGQYPKNTISSKICTISDVIESVEKGNCDIGILPFSYTKREEEKNSFEREEQEDKSVSLEERKQKVRDYPFVREKLSVCVPKNHALAVYDELTFEQINGFNCLLRDEIGFWTDLCYEKMPASKFLIQKDEFELEELIRTSTLFCFTTNFDNRNRQSLFQDRKIIPLIDNEADVTYHLICQAGKKEMMEWIFKKRNKISV